MAESREGRRILDMLAEGMISVDDATNLLKALGSERLGAGLGSGAEGAPRRKGARLVRISIDSKGDDAGEEVVKVRVNVPLSLAKFAGRFLPRDVSQELEEQGIDLTTLLDELGDEVSEGPLVEVDVAKGDEGLTTHIVIEVI